MGIQQTASNNSATTSSKITTAKIKIGTKRKNAGAELRVL
jgi:hypothetical protein